MEASSPFRFDDDLDAGISRAAERLRMARHTVALTGAGLSVECGIPPFRGPGGLWTKYGEPPLDGYQRFLRDPAAAWRERIEPREAWARSLRDTLHHARPGSGHLALAALERLGSLAAVITQNIDDLHRQAGTGHLLEIHGNYRLLRCIDCQRRFEPDEIEVDPGRLPPHCLSCGGLVKGDTVQFGEPIPPEVLRRCQEQAEEADCMLVIGTSATVYPAAELPLEVLRHGGSVIEVNPEESELTPLVAISLRGPAGPVMERLLDRVRKGAGMAEAG